MKIKQSFVTNSSSTSYIICIPSNINLKEFVNKYFITDTDTVKEDIINLIIVSLSNDRPIYRDDYDSEFFFHLEHVLSEFIIDGIETGPDGNEIHFISSDKLINKIHKLEEMVKNEN